MSSLSIVFKQKWLCIFWYAYFSTSVLGECCHPITSSHWFSFVSQYSRIQFYDKKISRFFFLSCKSIKIPRLLLFLESRLKFSAIYIHNIVWKPKYTLWLNLYLKQKYQILPPPHPTPSPLPSPENNWWVPHGIVN